MTIHQQTNPKSLSNLFDPATSPSIFLTPTSPSPSSLCKMSCRHHSHAGCCRHCFITNPLLGTSTAEGWQQLLKVGICLPQYTPGKARWGGFLGRNQGRFLEIDPDLKLNLISVSEKVAATTVAYERVQHSPFLPELDHSLRLSL